MLNFHRIEELRKQQGLSQSKLADMADVSMHSIFRLEKGTRIPKLDELQKIADALGVSIEEFIDNPEFLKRPQTDKGENQNMRIDTDLIEIPVVSREMTACCGPGIGALDVTSEPEETVGIPRNDLRAFDDLRPPFAIYANGDCLSSDGIDSDDRVVINPAEMPQNGAIALVSMFGMLALKRYYHLSNGDVILRSDEGERRLTPAEQEDADFSVLGAMVACVKKRPVAKPL